MKRLLLMALATIALSGCTTTVPLDPPTPPMSVVQARATLHGLHAKEVSAWVADADGHDLGVTGKDLLITHDALRFKEVVIPFRDIRRVNRWPDFNIGIALAAPTGMQAFVIGEQNTHGAVPGSALAAAIVTLKQAAEKYPAEQAAFERAVASYHAVNPKPVLPESIRRYQVQAEEAVRNREFQRAAETYFRALNEEPSWPQGHFNFALVLESLDDYELAIEEMQRYLALVPDAANARAAQDKIYQWQAHLPDGGGR